MNKLVHQLMILLSIMFIGISVSINAEESKNYSVQQRIIAKGLKSKKIIYHDKNKFGDVFVVENKNKRCMTFDPQCHRMQSCIDLNNPNYIIFKYIKIIMSSLFLTNTPPKDILIVGAGCGMLGNIMNKIIPTAKINMVEINPLVIKIAKKYFNFKTNENINVKIMDGYKFIMNSPAAKYDLVILDVSSKDYTPKKFLTVKLVENVKRILKNGGVVAVNTQLNSSYSEIHNSIYSEVFGEYKDVIIVKNRLIFTKNGTFPDCTYIVNNALHYKSDFALFNVSTNWILDKIKGSFQ